MSIQSVSLALIFGIIALAEPLSLRIAQAAPGTIKVDAPKGTLLRLGIAKGEATPTAQVRDRPLLVQRFSQWCQTKDSYPAATQKTILALLITARTKDCQQAELKLRSLRELSFSWMNIARMGSQLPGYRPPGIYSSSGIGSNHISDLRPLASLDNLISLELSGNPIDDLQPIANLTNLTSLRIAYSKVDNIQPLRGLVKLKKLDLNSNQISDLQPLGKLTNLVNLNLMRNQIRNPQPLTGLQNLTHLRLDYNQITNPNTLCGLPKSTNLSLENNPTSTLTCAAKALLQEP
jgi:internalin A